MNESQTLPTPAVRDRVHRRPKTNPSHRILVVDADPTVIQSITKRLRHSGYEAHTAEDGVTGWEALQANHYHLLITEYDLPGLMGVDLVRKLHAAQMTLPVVMASGRLPTYQLTLNPPLQLAAVLVKPFAVGTMLDMVRNVLRATNGALRPNRQKLPVQPDLELSLRSG